MTDELLLTVPEVMRTLKMGRSTVYDLIRCHEIASIKVRGARRVPLAAVQAYIADRLEAGGI